MRRWMGIQTANKYEFTAEVDKIAKSVAHAE
ncbi:MAG: hypothetical protein ACFWUC_01915 [Oscillospiraceae bacterium]|jgi:hypothetical protein